MQRLILVVITAMFLASCALFTNEKQYVLTNTKRYQCVRNLVEIKVPSKEAIGFCSTNFQDQVGGE